MEYCHLQAKITLARPPHALTTTNIRTFDITSQNQQKKLPDIPKIWLDIIMEDIEIYLNFQIKNQTS